MSKTRWWLQTAVGRGALVLAVGGAWSTALGALPVRAGAMAWQEGGVVAGVVVTMRGQPLGGARISLFATGAADASQTATTDALGRFRLTGVRGTEVIVSVAMIGYRPLRQTVRVGQEDLRLALGEQAVSLEDVIVTGTPGETQKRELGNSVGQLRPEDVLQVAPVREVTDMLSGRIPGVAVSRADGNVGGSGLITIRGRSTFSLLGYPLIYVDGVRLNSDYTGLNPEQITAVFSPLDLISAEDIESIEVVKGAAAATLYGTEAGSGVIQVITKRGRAGRRAEWNVSMRQGITTLTRANRFPTNYWRNPATGEVVSQNLVDTEKARGTPIFQTGHGQGYSMSLNGAITDFSYYTSVNFEHDEGVTPDNDAQRITSRANLSFQPHPTVSINTNFGLALTDTRQPNSNARGTYLGNIYNGSPSTRDTPRRGFWIIPPDVGAELFFAWERMRRATGGVRVDHRPTPWFDHRFTVGLDLGAEEVERLIPLVPGEWAPLLTAAQAGGSKGLTKNDMTTSTFDYAGTVTLPVRTGLTSKTSVGFQYYRKEVQGAFLSGTGFPGPGLTAISAAASRTATEQKIENATVGMYVQQQFGIRDRLFLTGAVRVDNNSAFGKELDFVTYPKVSASWVVNEEPFWNIGFINTLKLRAAFGASGNQPDAFAALRSYQATAGEGDQGALIPGSVGNPRLKPERSEEIEVGFDAALLDHRVGVEFSYYRKRTKDAILQTTVPPSSGFYPAPANVNAGEILNKGFELALNARPIETPTLGLDFNLSVFRNTNRVERLVAGVDFINVGWIPNRYQVGYPIASFFFKQLVSADKDANNNPINLMCDGGAGPLGLDRGGPAVPCAEAPRLFVGQPNPDWEGSFTSGLGWKNFRFTGRIDFKIGESTYDWNDHSRCVGRRLCEEQVSPEKYSAEILGAQLLASTFEGSYYVRELSFARLRELSVNYTLPPAMARRLLRASRASVTLAGRNLVTWTDYVGTDPEINYKAHFSNYDDSPWTVASTPIPAQFIITFNLGF